MTDIHSCSYFCTRPECIKAQRDELRAENAALKAELGDLPEAQSDMLSEIKRLKAELAALKLVGWLDARGRFFYSADPFCEFQSPGMTPVYLATGAKP